MNQENKIPLIAFTTLVVLLAAPVSSLAQSATQATQENATLHAKPPATARLELEPKAIEILKATSARMAAAHTLTFTAVETFESLSRQGAPLIYGNKFEVTLQRPNKLRVILVGDGPASEFYDDGKTVMAFAPAENLVAVADAQPTIDKTLEAVFHSAGIYFPFTDIIVTDPYGDMAPGLKHAYYVGQSKVVGAVTAGIVGQSKVVGETTTDIVAFAGDGVFVQMWVGTEDKLPHVIHAIYLDDPDHLRHNLILSDWQLDPTVTADAFTSSAAISATHMQFARPDSDRYPGAKPPTRTSPPKSQ